MTSVLDKLKELDRQTEQLSKQRQQLLSQVKSEALASAQSAVDALNVLGFNYRLVEGSGSGKKGTRTVKDAPCPTCNFKTNPPHDRRAHKSQTTKAAFSSAELTERGLAKIE